MIYLFPDGKVLGLNVDVPEGVADKLRFYMQTALEFIELVFKPKKENGRILYPGNSLARNVHLEVSNSQFVLIRESKFWIYNFRVIDPKNAKEFFEFLKMFDNSYLNPQLQQIPL